MTTRSSFGLEHHGLTNLGHQHWNLTTDTLIEQALANNETVEAKGGALVATTGPHTGRSASDRFVVKDTTTAESVWWSKTNVAMTEEHFQALLHDMQAHLTGQDVYVQDCLAGADKNWRQSVRVVTETAWHNHFARNMFIQPTATELEHFQPNITVIHAPSFKADPARHGTNSETVVVLNFTRGIVLIGGTAYAGEIKKSVFSYMNFILPAKGVLPMHASANTDAANNTAIFFGLSGTGKTTLSADSSRTLVGDDEHGWSDTGVFNFEGGCYAKAIRLSKEAEPEIYATTSRKGTIMENVVLKDDSTPDFDDGTLTENTRISYPIDFIPNASKTGIGGAPTTVIMLTADAFGVMPPISKLTAEQAMYHFLSGYTAKVAGTEMGMGNEPQATFSACFGLPFMPRHPAVYAKLLGSKIAAHQVGCWLVNTGWTGGVFGTGERISIKHTRAMVNAALSGDLDNVETRTEAFFGLHVPTSCPHVPDDVLDPRSTWADKAAYDVMAKKVKAMFEENFKQYEDEAEKLFSFSKEAAAA